MNTAQLPRIAIDVDTGHPDQETTGQIGLDYVAVGQNLGHQQSLTAAECSQYPCWRPNYALKLISTGTHRVHKRSENDRDQPTQPEPKCLCLKGIQRFPTLTN